MFNLNITEQLIWVKICHRVKIIAFIIITILLVGLLLVGIETGVNQFKLK